MILLKENLKHFRLNLKNLEGVFKPLFYRINKTDDRKKFTDLLATPGLNVFDNIEGQLTELVKIKSPSKKFTVDELNAAVQLHIAPLTMEEYGVWVYYPWSNRLVHIVDESEFVEIRTSRNQYKITKEEREILSTKKIGVIGLSVGQSVAVTLAMERIFGELRLADFDLLELTNLNRIRTGVQNLGLPKVYSVAREIAEIDPFLTIKCFAEGIIEANIDSFFMDGGKLDLMIEESDGFDIKIISRYKARELQVPVLMEASDRCAIDIERFDLEPARSILHGLVDHLDITTLKSLKTTEEKIPYMLDMLGLDTASLRLKASMLEIEQSINTWPQLASAVTMGGGIAADVSRRLLLNQFTKSGRYHVDIEELIGENKPDIIIQNNNHNYTPTDFVALANKLAIGEEKEEDIISETAIEKIIEAGCKAPSGGNSQPWRWVYKNNVLLLFLAFDGTDHSLGHDNLGSYLALGAAAENVVLRAAELGFDATVKPFPDDATSNLVATFSFNKKTTSSTDASHLSNAIDIRLTNRMLNKKEKIADSILTTLVNTAQETGVVNLEFITDDDELNLIGDLLGELEKIRLLEKTGHRDFVNEIRWTAKESEEQKDGVDLRTIDLTNTEIVGLKVAKNESVIELINKWNGGDAFKKLTIKAIDTASAVGVFTINDTTPTAYFNSGRMVQRVWLAANLNGIAFHPLTASVFMYARLIKGKGVDISKKGCDKLWALRPTFEKIFKIDSDKKNELFIFRLSIADQPKVKSLRKPLKDVYTRLRK